MINLKDVTLVIPVKYDHPDRIRNAEYIIQYFSNPVFKNVEIIIIEVGEDRHFEQVAKVPFVDYHFRQEEKFHRTKILNDGFKLSKRKFVASYDVDCFISHETWHKVLNNIEHTNILYPFDGMFINIYKELIPDLPESLPDCKELSERIYNAKNIKNFNKAKSGDGYRIWYGSIGGIIFFKRDYLLKIGGYNENFMSWGPEDLEIYDRFFKLGNGIIKLQTCLYHLEHKRGIDSTYKNPDYKQNRKEYIKLKPRDVSIDTIEQYMGD